MVLHKTNITIGLTGELTSICISIKFHSTDDTNICFASHQFPSILYRFDYQKCNVTEPYKDQQLTCSKTKHIT